jgi:hypothetical protein
MLTSVENWRPSGAGGGVINIVDSGRGLRLWSMAGSVKLKIADVGRKAC